MIPFPDKKYQVILADPPWRYGFSKSSSRKVENHYDTMKLKDIMELKVPADSKCVLYLWATAPKLLEALKVMTAWGFQYKTNAVWDKKLMGMGYWFRGRHELLLIGTKGKISPPEPSKRVPSVLEYVRTKHSKKPVEVREMINEWFPNFKKIELFARERISGWDAWGLEV